MLHRLALATSRQLDPVNLSLSSCWYAFFSVHATLGIRPPDQELAQGADSQDRMDQIMTMARIG